MHHIMSSSKLWAWLHLSLNHFCGKLYYYMLEERGNGCVNAKLFWKKINWQKGKGNYERSGKNGLTNLGPEREQWTFTEHLRGWRLNIINTEAVPGLIAGRAQGGVTLLIEILPLRGSSNCKSKSSFNTSLTAIWFHKSKSITFWASWPAN